MKLDKMEGHQDTSALEHVYINTRDTVSDVLRRLQCGEVVSNVDYSRYKIDWLLSLITRTGTSLQVSDAILRNLREVQHLLAILDGDIYSASSQGTPSHAFHGTIVTGCRGRPKLDIPREQLECLLRYGFTGTEIARMLGVCDKTVYRRLESFGLSMSETYSTISDSELDFIVGNIVHQFPNSGYKAMRGHLALRGIKIQERRVRETMRRTDPEGTVIRGLQLRVTHRRSYNVRAPLSLWHMDGHHKLVRYSTNSFRQL